MKANLKARAATLPQAATVSDRLAAARANRHKFIAERNLLLAVFTRLWPSHVAPSKYGGWPWTVCVHSPAGQLAWRITDEERTTIFAHLPMQASDWDGHTTAKRTRRLQELAEWIEPHHVKGEVLDSPGR